jgi:hypothetical protein
MLHLCCLPFEIKSAEKNAGLGIANLAFCKLRVRMGVIHGKLSKKMPFPTVFSKRRLVVLIVLLSLFARASSWASGIALAWNPSTSPTVTGYEVYYGLASNNYTWSVNAGANTNISISGLSLGQTYYFAVVAYDSYDYVSPPSIVVSASPVNFSNAPPQITNQPSSITVNAGAVASFSVGAVSTSPMTYQWFAGAVVVPGETNPILNLPNVTAADAGSYFATIQNDAGTATSSNAVLTITNPPVLIITNPPVLPVTNLLLRKQYVHNYIGTSATITPTAGDCLVAFAQVNAIAPLTISDGVNNWVTQQTAQSTIGESITLVAATALNVAGTPVTVSFTGSTTDAGITVIEYSGVSGIDTSAQATTTSTLAVVLNTAQTDAFVCGWGNEGNGEDDIDSETFNPGNLTPALIQHDTAHYDAEWDVQNSGAGFLAGTYTNTYVGSANGCLVVLALITIKSPPQNFSASMIPGQGLQLQLTGTPGIAYVLLATTNLVQPINWQPIFTNAADANGNWTFIDTNALTMPSRFYRAMLP